MTEHFLRQFAETSHAQSGNVFDALGIDWKMLVFQIIGFLILVWVMGKFVYPVLIKTVDARQEKFEAGAKAAAEAEAKAKKAEADIEKLMNTARNDAGEIVTTAHDEAAAMLQKADEKSKQNAEQVLKNAHEQINKDIASARVTLEKDTLNLVAQATEKIVGSAVTKSVDEKLIKQSLKDVQ